MTTTLYTPNGPVPRDENVIRSTTATIENDAPADMQDSAPDYNDFTSAKHEDGGLTTNTLSSHVTPSERYIPTITNADQDLFTATNSQVSSSGTAAAKELTGRWGHGTFKVVEGIEPTIVDGTQFDNLYFKGNVGVLQGAAGDMTAASISDPATTGLVEQTRRAKAALSAQGPIYQAMLDASKS
jgi:hypothetical protein